MFTGLVEEIGAVRAIEPRSGGARLEIDCVFVADGLALGDSVAVNGACLTVVELRPDGFAVDCVAETLRRTALGALAPGDPVNLERALRLGDRLGGHLVQGHVDGLGVVTGCDPEGEGWLLRVGAPEDLLAFVVEKGSVAVDGVSLTVAARERDGFTIALIPHTVSATTLGPGRVGGSVNLEVDMVAKYVAQLVEPYRTTPAETGTP